MSLRLPDELADQIRAHAERAGHSVNRWIALVLGAAVDPELAGSEAERVRERLARAGLLAPTGAQGTRPDKSSVARARAAAGRGRTLGEMVTDNRK